MEEEFEDYGMEMPCICEKCGNWFDLNDGWPSLKLENIVICESCGRKEEEECERLDEIYDLLNDLSDAEQTIKDVNERLKELNYNAAEDCR